MKFTKKSRFMTGKARGTVKMLMDCGYTREEAEAKVQMVIERAEKQVKLS